ncbi:carbonic anhydrase 4-like [Brachionus plicatilis]|uniref:Carbonic anhydrase n=1 Tax=Brachionus plicatilis TaxID=10195 RepID=A0A3M7SEK5_BRAPC|nr:carbonic anhydrase 4-like [Brachionus plicatilis]
MGDFLCSSPSDSNLVVHIGSDDRLEFFSSKLRFSWLEALKQSENFNVNLLVLNNFNQMINFIDFAIKNELSGPFWIGAFALDTKMNWIDGSNLPKGPWLPSYKNCVNYQVGQGLVCFALENYQVVIKNCDQEYQSLFVQGINFSRANLQSLIARLSAFTVAPRTTTQPANSEEWNYKNKGPDYWAVAFENCRAESQSPINIVGSSATFDRGLRDFVFLNYNRIISWNVVNNGHSISASPIPTESNKPFIRGSDFTERYNLLNFHFHWGFNIYQGSEHLLNGNKFPLEVHLVHQSPSGKIAVLGFFFEIAPQKNPKLDKIISVANIKNKTDIRQIDFSLFSMLPAAGAVLNRRGYFRYSGSFTTPPCTEGVTWTVFRMKIPISKEQVEKFYESGIDINFREIFQKINKITAIVFSMNPIVVSLKEWTRKQLLDKVKLN